jgi:DNA excision repair protein ERCC-4
VILVSPTEPPDLRVLGETSGIPEEYGADFVFPAATGLVAVQRKTVPDLLASMRDGRLAREIPLLRRAEHPILLLEGRPLWTDEGLLMSDDRWRREGWYGVELSLQFAHGIGFVLRDDIHDTARWLRYAPSWFERSEHMGLLQRPKPTDNLGNVPDRDFALHILQSFPGIGPKVAEAIWSHFGRLPLGLSVDPDELAKVPGMGRVRVATMMRLLGVEGKAREKRKVRRPGAGS